MDDLIDRLAIGQVWPKAIADEYADTLTPRQVTMLYEASNVCYEAKDRIEAQAAEIARLTDHLKDAQEIIQRQMGWKTEAQNENERLREWALKAYTIVEWACGEGILLQPPHFDCDDALIDGAILLGVETSEQARQALQEPK